MDRPCDHCDQPDTSLLRVVLIAEIIRAEESTLYTLAGVCEAIGLLQFSADADADAIPPKPRKRRKRNLRRVK